MLNIAGPEYDYASVVFVVLQECEHRRRGWDDSEFEEQAMATARAKLATVKAAYDEYGGAANYWERLQQEVLEVVMPQYIEAAQAANEREKSGYGVWRGGDPAARATFALIGLIIGSIIIAIPWIKIDEVMFAFALTVAGALYPDMVRFTHQRRHSRVLNRLISESAAYQENARLHYMTLDDIQKSLVPGEDPRMRLASPQEEPQEEPHEAAQDRAADREES
jgi:hypothetical protein